ncbi:MAG: DUF928 domain-containing protein [Myxococcota bacterium]
MRNRASSDSLRASWTRSIGSIALWLAVVLLAAHRPGWAADSPADGARPHPDATATDRAVGTRVEPDGGADRPAQSEPAAERAARLPSRPPLVYVPPNRGRARQTAGAGTRSAAPTIVASTADGAPPRITPLAPTDHVGLTTRASPTLYWHLSAPTTSRVELWLFEGDEPLPVAKHALPAPVRAGLHAASLASLGVTLAPDIDYRWLVVLVHDLAHRDRDVLVERPIRRIRPAEQAAERSSPDDAAQRARVAASQGLWYDAFDALAAARDAQGDEAALRADRRDLLAQVGIAVELP